MNTTLKTGTTSQDERRRKELMLGLDYQVVGDRRDLHPLKSAKNCYEFPALALRIRPPETENFIQFDLSGQQSADSQVLVGEKIIARDISGWCPEPSFEGLVLLMLEEVIPLNQES